jgi:hypothetical protein
VLVFKNLLQTSSISALNLTDICVSKAILNCCALFQLDNGMPPRSISQSECDEKKKKSSTAAFFCAISML